MIARDKIETAYAFFHQKERVYAYSNMDWQKEDIEYAVASYVADMDKELLALLADGRTDFLVCHARFHADIKEAVARMETMLGI